MMTCEQTQGQTIYQHGESVRAHLFDLINYLHTGEFSSDISWQLPDWLALYREQIIEHLLPAHILSAYTLYHDCGKPYCRTVDADGRQHFPDHAQVSHDVWLAAGGSPEVARLILRDMEIHKLKADGVVEFCRDPQEAVSLLLTGLAEVQSNSRLFGGTSSTSYKIKFKHIQKQGRRICEYLFGAPEWIKPAKLRVEERALGKGEVTGSTPVAGSSIFDDMGASPSGLRLRTANPVLAGSTPAAPSISLAGLLAATEGGLSQKEGGTRR